MLTSSPTWAQFHNWQIVGGAAQREAQIPYGEFIQVTPASVNSFPSPTFMVIRAYNAANINVQVLGPDSSVLDTISDQSFHVYRCDGGNPLSSGGYILNYGDTVNIQCAGVWVLTTSGQANTFEQGVEQGSGGDLPSYRATWVAVYYGTQLDIDLGSGYNGTYSLDRSQIPNPDNSVCGTTYNDTLLLSNQTFPGLPPNWVYSDFFNDGDLYLYRVFSNQVNFDYIYNLFDLSYVSVLSSNPNSGVYVNATTDANGSGGNYTSFTNTYYKGTTVALQAPSTANGNNFQEWDRNGSFYTNSSSVTFNADTTWDNWTAVYATPNYTLTVVSQDPTSGASITVSPSDNNGNGNGTTPFTRVYNQGTTVTLTAPQTAPDGNLFEYWQVGGSQVWNTAINVTMGGNTTATAIYGTPLVIASQNPNSGVQVSVAPLDGFGNGSGTTELTRYYSPGTQVVLTAPPTAPGGNNFQYWQVGSSQIYTLSATFTVGTQGITATAVYSNPGPWTLTVDSSNPNSGVSITVSPNDNNNNGNGTTPFTRVYNNGTSVSLTAPSTAGGNNFLYWTVDGSQQSGQTISVTMNANHTVIAYYSTPGPWTLTVDSSNPSSGVSITVSLNDNNGNGNGTTPFTRVYNNGTTVSLTAPSTAGGNNFKYWTLDGSQQSGQTISVTMNANHTVIAYYSTPGPWTLTVDSVPPGVQIGVSPNDNNGNGNGTTDFTRIYNNGITVSLTAPPTFGIYKFLYWTLDGSQQSGQTISVTMGANHTVVLYYAPQPTITGLNPNWWPLSGASVSMTINGAGFESGDIAQWNGQQFPGGTQYLSPTQLSVTVPASWLTVDGVAAVTVLSPEGFQSNGSPFVVLALSNMQPNQKAVQGGVADGVLLQLYEHAPSTPSTAVTVNLSSNSSAITVPGSVTVPAGANQVSFTAQTHPVSADNAVTITAALPGGTDSVTTTIAVQVASLNSVSVKPTSILGGQTASGQVVLAQLAGPGGDVITLNSNDSHAIVPSSLTIPQDGYYASFAVQTLPVVKDTNVTITASDSQPSTVTCTFTVRTALITGVQISPTTQVGGLPISVKVTLEGPAGSPDDPVNFHSSPTGYIKGSSGGIPAGDTSFTFLLDTAPVNSSIVVTLTASRWGHAKTATVTLVPLALRALNLALATIKGGGSTFGEVYLNAPAPTGGVAVSLTVSRGDGGTPHAHVAATVSVLAGNSTAEFPISTDKVTTTEVDTITATFPAGTSYSKTLTITP